tara:strand:+ start:89 stop:208 length:120 start_codon:yes stop_codon:yes gene_type:complete
LKLTGNFISICRLNQVKIIKQKMIFWMKNINITENEQKK